MPQRHKMPSLKPHEVSASQRKCKTLLTDSNGELEVNLFAGDYEITINGDHVFDYSFSAGNGLETLRFDGTALTSFKAPDVVLTEPVDDAVYASGPAVALGADTPDGGSVVSVDFMIDGRLIKTDGQPPYTAVLYDVGLGTHQLTAVARNSSGMATTSNAVTVEIESTGGNLVDNPGFESGIDGWSEHGGLSIEAQGALVYTGGASGRACRRFREINSSHSSHRPKVPALILARATSILSIRWRSRPRSRNENACMYSLEAWSTSSKRSSGLRIISLSRVRLACSSKWLRFSSRISLKWSSCS